MALLRAYVGQSLRRGRALEARLSHRSATASGRSREIEALQRALELGRAVRPGQVGAAGRGLGRRGAAEDFGRVLGRHTFAVLLECALEGLEVGVEVDGPVLGLGVAKSAKSARRSIARRRRPGSRSLARAT
jgi:hypothetical protein